MRRLFRLSPVLGALVLAASSAHAQDATLDKALAAMVAANGDAYVAVRAEVAALPGMQERVHAALAKAQWTPETFPRLAMAVVVQAHLAHPDVVRRVYRLEGLDPAHYGKRRRPDPECGRELRRLGATAVGPMLELYLKTFESYPFTPVADQPDAIGLQRAALREGLMIALAESGHPVAFFVLRHVASNPEEPEGTRKQAIEGLGTIGTPAAFAELVQLDASAPAIKLAVIRGVAQVPTQDALGWLAKRLDGDADERRATVVAIGTFGSAWTWEARGASWAGVADELRSAASNLLIDRLEQLAPVCQDQVVEALATIAHPSAVARLRQLVEAPDGRSTRATAKAALGRVMTAVERNRG